MLLGRKATSRASVGRKPYVRVSFQKCPPLKIHGEMLLGRKAASRASVGRKPYVRVSFQECPRGRCVKSSFDSRYPKILQGGMRNE